MHAHSLWAVVPAAGSGSRMQNALPKQYLPFLQHTVIEHTLHSLLATPHLRGLVVSLSADDQHFAALNVAKHPLLIQTQGGDDRATSVRHGLQKLLSLGAHESDWVLVHDAARPCVKPAAILQLLAACAVLPSNQIAGAILAVPVADTLKKANSAALASVQTPNTIECTVPREQLWQAHTPQCFRLGDLLRALNHAQTVGATITDEASAIEVMGGRVFLVEDSRENIKITRPDDLALALLIAQKQS